jgi:hypothetical protein
MLTEQMKDDLRKVTWKWKKPAIPFSPDYSAEQWKHLTQPRHKVLRGFSLLHSMRAIR